MSELFEVAKEITRAHAESFRAGIAHESVVTTRAYLMDRLRAVAQTATDAVSEILTLRLQNKALFDTKARLHAQLRGLRVELYGECETCREQRGYFGDADQPCPDCNSEGDPRDAP